MTLQFTPPLVKFPSLFPGQMGVNGAEVAEGLRLIPDSNPIYVDGSLGTATDDNDGTNPDFPKLTIQGAIDVVTAGDVIVINKGTYAETLTANLTTTPDNVSVIGLGKVTVEAALATAAVLTLGATWSFENIEFLLGTATGVSLVETASIDASGSVFTNCIFNGQGDCLVGVDLNGAPSGVKFIGCVFYNIAETGTGAVALTSSVIATDEPDFVVIDGCKFYDNDGHVDLDVNVSFILNSIFLVSGNVDVTVANGVLDISGGAVGHNVVYGNLFDGDFSIAGGYVDNTTGASTWVGNFAVDTAETEVDTTGLVIAAPAA